MNEKLSQQVQFRCDLPRMQGSSAAADNRKPRPAAAPSGQSFGPILFKEYSPRLIFINWVRQKWRPMGT
jgi:hypothetical protein